MKKMASYLWGFGIKIPETLNLNLKSILVISIYFGVKSLEDYFF